MVKTISAHAPVAELEEALRLAEEVWLVDSNNRMGPNNDREWLEMVAGAPRFADEVPGDSPAAHEPDIVQLIVDSTNAPELKLVRAAVLEILSRRTVSDATPVD